MSAQALEARLEQRRPRPPGIKGRTVRLNGPAAHCIGDKPFPQNHQGDQVTAFCVAQLWAKAKKELTTQHRHVRNIPAIHQGVLDRPEDTAAWLAQNVPYHFLRMDKELRASPWNKLQVLLRIKTDNTKKVQLNDIHRAKSFKTCGMTYTLSFIMEADGA